MLGWFRPSCPCDPTAKQWVEERLRWLAEQFGLHILLERRIVLPTDEFFPDRWDGSDDAARAMFRRVCEYMLVKPGAVSLDLFHDATPTPIAHNFGFAAGTWNQEHPWMQSTVRIERGGLWEPSNLVGVMAHELAHQKLLGERRYDRNAFDSELLTDLTAVYFGFGVFLANNPRKSTGKLEYWPDTRLRRPEYMSGGMLGYAMAHIAWHRDEEPPEWARCLRRAPRAEFNASLKYLQHTGDSSFKPVRLK